MRQKICKWYDLKCISIWLLRCSNCLECGVNGVNFQPCMVLLIVGATTATCKTVWALKLHTCIPMTIMLLHLTMMLNFICYSLFPLCHLSNYRNNFACDEPTIPYIMEEVLSLMVLCLAVLYGFRPSGLQKILHICAWTQRHTKLAIFRLILSANFCVFKWKVEWKIQGGVLWKSLIVRELNWVAVHLLQWKGHTKLC